MSCKVCHSTNQSTLSAEINIHPPALPTNMDKPTVWAFPVLAICEDCGFTEVVLTEAERCDLSNKKRNQWVAT